jgi:phospholipid/cholesterol/gamma-HCH transport system substrate-binding protein
MRSRGKTYVRFLAIFGVLGALGLGAASYVLLKERVPLPFRDVMTLRADFSEADGVVRGIGQPVNVVGVRVGQVIGVDVVNGRARVTMELRRDRTPRLYDNATAVLEPITPLKDMQIALDPGGPPARRLPPGATLRVGSTRPPVPLSDLLSTLDADTRAYLGSLIAGLDEGTRGRGPDLRRALLALGPTTSQVGSISRALAQRRRALARLVTNLATVTHAASRDDELAGVVAAGARTLRSLAAQDQPLRNAIARLPGTMALARSTLVKLKPFATRLRPSLDALLPGVRRLPSTLRAVSPFAETGSRTLRRDLRPFVRDALPLARAAGPAVANMAQATPDLTGAARVLDYLVNELAFNPPGDDEGFLFWLAWAVHNLNSENSTGDAHGSVARAAIVVSCDAAGRPAALQKILGVVGVCPR